MSSIPTRDRPRWQRALWLAAGVLSLVIGLVGIVVPLLPTAPLVLLAAFCFSRGSERWEAWLLKHPRFGPMILDWRTNRAVPLRAKQLATLMMTGSSVLSWWLIPSPWNWSPGVCCAAVAVWLWSLPTAAVAAKGTAPSAGAAQPGTDSSRSRSGERP